MTGQCTFGLTGRVKINRNKINKINTAKLGFFEKKRNSTQIYNYANNFYNNVGLNIDSHQLELMYLIYDSLVDPMNPFEALLFKLVLLSHDTPFETV